MSYYLHCTDEYFRDGTTGGCGYEFDWNGQQARSLSGSLEEAKRFDSEAEAWEWIGIDPEALPADEVVEGEYDDDRYTRRYTLENGSVVVTDTPTNEWFASSRIVRRVLTVRPVI